MRLSEFLTCLNTSTIQPTPLLDKIRIASETGYQAIEPWNEEVDRYLSQGGTLADLQKAVKDSGLKVVSVIALGDWTQSGGPAYQAALEVCRKRMDQAAALGSPYIVASPPQAAVDLGFASSRFAELVKLGREAGVTPSMEFLGFVDGINNVESALTIADGCGTPGATIVADVFHMIRGGGSVDDLLKFSGDRLSCFHINDIPAIPDPLSQTDHDRVMLNDGVADLPRVVRNLRSIGYAGPVSLELFNRSLWSEDPAEVAKIGLERLQALLES